MRVVAQFNPIEIRQAFVRVTNSIVENNSAGAADDRNGRGDVTAATIHIRGAQPIIAGNIFRDNTGPVISIDVNSLSYKVTPDWGRETGTIAAFDQYADNHGPLVRANRLANNDINGMVVRGGALTTADLLKLVRERTFLVYLKASPEELFARVKETDRPLLAEVKGLDDFRRVHDTHMKHRQGGYEQAELTVETDR